MICGVAPVLRTGTIRILDSSAKKESQFQFQDLTSQKRLRILQQSGMNSSTSSPHKLSLFRERLITHNSLCFCIAAWEGNEGVHVYRVLLWMRSDSTLSSSLNDFTFPEKSEGFETARTPKHSQTCCVSWRDVPKFSSVSNPGKCCEDSWQHSLFKQQRSHWQALFSGNYSLSNWRGCDGKVTFSWNAKAKAESYFKEQRFWGTLRLVDCSHRQQKQWSNRLWLRQCNTSSRNFWHTDATAEPLANGAVERSLDQVTTGVETQEEDHNQTRRPQSWGVAGILRVSQSNTYSLWREGSRRKRSCIVKLCTAHLLPLNVHIKSGAIIKMGLIDPHSHNVSCPFPLRQVPAFVSICTL